MPFDLASAKPVSAGFDLATAKPVPQAPGIMSDIGQGLGNLTAGAIRGAGSIGATILYPIDKATDLIMGDRGPTVGGLISGKQPLSRNEERRQQMDEGLQAMGAQPDSWLYKGGKLAGEIAGTAGAGGLVANGVRAAAPLLEGVGMAAPTLQALANSAASSGFTTGMAPGIGNTLMRMAGGGLAGAASAGLVDPHNVGMGAAVGAALPPVLAGAGKVAGYAGSALNSLAQPFTTAGQNAIAGKIINKFADGGPTAVDASQIVPGSAPTLAEATGNPGIARLQSAASDLAPNAFSARQAANSAARGAAFDDVAGDAGKLDFFRASRAQAADDLYSKAADSYSSDNMTPYLKGQVTQLLKRPSIDAATRTAQQWAIERGETPFMNGSFAGLHDTKTALDDQISAAVRAGQGGQAEALAGTKAKLLDVMEKLSPEYKEARLTYQAMSQPVNQMEVLQGLKLTDATGNMTLSKVQNALDGLSAKMDAPGINPAKSLTADQIGVLQSIRDDLVRKSSLNAGKSAGSNTFQNIATDNILSTMLPGKVGELAKGKIGGVAGQLGKLMYSGPNDAIRSRLQELMLNPAEAPAAMQAGAAPAFPRAATALQNLSNYVAPPLYRAAPVLETDR